MSNLGNNPATSPEDGHDQRAEHARQRGAQDARVVNLASRTVAAASGDVPKPAGGNR